MGYIKVFHDAYTLSVSKGKNYSEGKIMYIFMDNFHQSGKYSALIASHHEELGEREILLIKNIFSISSLQTDYLNVDRSSGFDKNIERENLVHTKFTFCGGDNHSAHLFSKVWESKRKISSS